MLPDYKANEIVFNMEGKVKGGTIAALVERLTQHDVVGKHLRLSAFNFSWSSKNINFFAVQIRTTWPPF